MIADEDDEVGKGGRVEGDGGQGDETLGMVNGLLFEMTMADGLLLPTLPPPPLPLTPPVLPLAALTTFDVRLEEDELPVSEDKNGIFIDTLWRDVWAPGLLLLLLLLDLRSCKSLDDDVFKLFSNLVAAVLLLLI